MSGEIYVPFDAPPWTLIDPRWDNAGRVHEWRNHVGERTRAVWATFTDEQRAALAADAEDQVSAEEWD